MMLCLEKRLKSNTCITAVDSRREDLEIWDRGCPERVQVFGIREKKKNKFTGSELLSGFTGFSL